MFGHVRILSSKRGPDEHRWSQVRILPTVLILFLLFGSSLYVLVLLCCIFYSDQKYFLLVLFSGRSFHSRAIHSSPFVFDEASWSSLKTYWSRSFHFCAVDLSSLTSCPDIHGKHACNHFLLPSTKKQYFLVRLPCRFIISYLLIPLSVKQATPFCKDEKSFIVTLNTMRSFLLLATLSSPI